MTVRELMEQLRKFDSEHVVHVKIYTHADCGRYVAQAITVVEETHISKTVNKETIHKELFIIGGC